MTGAAPVSTEAKTTFTVCFAALVATTFCFSLRAFSIDTWGVEFGLTETQKGELAGVGLWPFSISIVLLSLIVDRVGFKALLWFAAACHLLGLVIILQADGYWSLYWGTFVLSLGNGAASVTMGWHPENGFIDSRWIGYDEAMLIYALALGSPSHPIPPEAWNAWTSGYRWERFQGQEYVMFGPLFGHQYSHVWLDFRGIQDAYMRGRGIDYFENSRRATLAHRAYAAANPNGWRAYADSVWGLTASDGPLDSAFVLLGRQRQFHTYWARGAGTDEINDDGTLVPTAAGGSVPFAPEIAIPALHAMRRQYGDPLFGRYGFVDAFNPSLVDANLKVPQGRIHPGVGWFDTDYLGIDQGPILLMIENQRTQFVWRLLRANPHLTRGLCRAGFTGGWLAGRCQ